jgi:cytochrome c553
MRHTLLLLAFAACTPATAQPDKAADGKQAFKTVHEAFLHPRCRNCHPAGDAPL